MVHCVLNFPELWISSRNTTKLQSAEQFYTKTLVRKCGQYFSMQCLHYIVVLIVTAALTSADLPRDCAHCFNLLFRETPPHTTMFPNVGVQRIFVHGH